MRRGFLVLAVTAAFAVLGALSDTLDILDFWQRRTKVPSGEGGLPEADRRNSERSGAVESPASRENAVRTEPENRAAGRASPEPASSNVESLVNHRAVPSGSVPRMAIALDGDSPDVELLEAALAREVSSAELRLVTGLFKPAFRKQGFLRAAYDGDTDALTSSGALAAVDRLMIGRVERACHETGQFDTDLVTCDLRLYFKVIDQHGAVANAGHVAVAGAGFSENAARDRAVEMLVQQHGKRIVVRE